MTQKLIQFEGGDVLATKEPRTIYGLLIPYNEVGRTNVGRFQVEAGAVDLPSDPAIVGLNIDHERSAPVGRAIRIEEKRGGAAPGIYAAFQFADTPEGRAAYADAISPSGKRRKLSGEFGPAVIKAGRLVSGYAKLWGAAVVEAGAFPSAQVLAADTPDEEIAEAEAEVDVEPVDDVPATDPAHVVLEAETLPTFVAATTPGGDAAIYTSSTEPEGEPTSIDIEVDQLPTDITITTPAGESAVYTPEAAPAEEPTESEGVTVTASATGAKAPAVPQTVLAGVHKPALVKPRPVDLRQVFAAMADIKANPHDQAAAQVLAALSDIKITGAGALPAADVLRPNWVGQLYQGIPYEREYITLANLGTDISAAGKKGFTVHRGTSGSPIASPAGIPNGGDWPGNKSEINSYAGFTQTQGSSLRKFAVGHDIAREFYDLPGGAEVIEAFLKLVIEDHLYWSDSWALYELQVAAGVPVAPATGDYPSDYPAALGQLIQGILAVKARKADGRRDVPTYAIANEKAFKALVYATGGEQNLPAFVKIDLSTASNGTIDGEVHVVQGETGIHGTASVIVGAKKAVEFDELAGGPLHIDALELAKGGVDRAVHGYLQTFHVRDEAVVHIGTAPARANDTDYAFGDLVARGSNVYRVVKAGTSHSSTAPTPEPAVGATITDGTVEMLRLV